MKKYEAPIAELEIFAVENIMDDYNAGGDDSGLVQEEIDMI